MTSRNITAWNHIDQWQAWWDFFWEQGFPIFTESMEPNTLNYVHLGNPTKVVQHVKKVSSCFALVEKIQKKFPGTWNYLGPVDERSKYIEHITETFWNHQNDTTLNTIDDYKSIVEHPWRMLNISSQLSFDVPMPSDMFSERSRDLVFKLIQRFQHWEYDQCYIQNPDAALQWKAEAEIQATGWIEKADKHFNHIIILDDSASQTYIDH